MSLSQEMKDAIKSVRLRAACQRITGIRNTITMHTPMLSPTTVRTENTIARKVSVQYIPGGGYEIDTHEYRVETAHEKLCAVRNGYRLHEDEERVGWPHNRSPFVYDVIFLPNGRAHMLATEGERPPRRQNHKGGFECYQPKPRPRNESSTAEPKNFEDWVAEMEVSTARHRPIVITMDEVDTKFFTPS